MTDTSSSDDRLGIDTGGTFTDFVLLRGAGDGESRVEVHKRPSTPDDPSRAILEGLAALGLADAEARRRTRIVHGTTVATNAALEQQGARTLFVTNAGLEDTLLIGRQARPDIYALTVSRAPSPIEAGLCLGVPCRLDAQGRVVEALTDAAVAALREAARASAPEAIAISLLFAYLDPSHEHRLAAALEDIAPVTCSSDLLPEYGEYERGMATWLNAWLSPRTGRYMRRLADAVAPTPVEIMHSAGGTYPIALAAERPARLILSGPAGGLTAARTLSREGDGERLLTFDMGGTSTDVGLVDGDIELTTAGRIGGFPLALPMFDIHTIGAGGGSLAELDATGTLTVGPRSAGADPGPACYGRGGRQATVTDAHVVLGRLPAALRLGGAMALDVAAAEHAVARLGTAMALDAAATARGIIDLANQHMAQALRVMTLERGRDPRDFTLACFGGAGGLHLCELADALGIRRALVPRLPGTLSALGMIQAVPERQLSRTVQLPLEAHADAAAVLQALEDDGRRRLAASGVPAERIGLEASADLRYAGQTFTLNVPWGSATALRHAYQAQHERRFGHALDLPVECLNLRVRAFAREEAPRLPPWPALPRPEPLTDHSSPTLPCFARNALGRGETLRGPCLVVEETATTWVAEGWHLTVDGQGHLRLQRSPT